MLHYDELLPDSALAPYVRRFWQLRAPGEAARPVWLLPDGCIDVLFGTADTEPFRVVLLGLASTVEQTTLAAGAHTCAVSLRLPAAEYLLRRPVADLLDHGQQLPAGLWGITTADLADLGQFAGKLSATLRQLLPPAPDPRKLCLFELLYASHGTRPVHELADHAGWSSRQINRYFQQYFGLSLKAYCRILRFWAALPQLRAGRLYPEQDFADQAHFGREVRRLAGVRPKDLARNQDDRFILFSV